jgi:hypothetical protein
MGLTQQQWGSVEKFGFGFGLGFVLSCFAVLGFELRVSCLQSNSILLWLFWRWGLENYLPRLALSLNPPTLPSSWDYR